MMQPSEISKSMEDREIKVLIKFQAQRKSITNERVNVQSKDKKWGKNVLT